MANKMLKGVMRSFAALRKSELAIGLSLAVTALSGCGDEAAAAEILLFTPAEHCQVKPSGSYTKCKEIPRADVQVNFAAPRLSATEDEFLNSLQKKISLTYSFPCSFSLPITAKLNLVGDSQVVVAGSPATTMTWSADADSTAAFAFSFSTSSFNTLGPNCALEVLSAIAVPQVSPIKIYAKLLRRTLVVLDGLDADLSPNTDSVEVVSSLEEGIETLDNVLVIYEDASEIAKAGLRAARERLTNAKNLVNQACQNGSSAPLCTSSINSALGHLQTARQEAVTALNGLKAFLESEVERLETAQTDIALQLETLLATL